MSEKGSLLAELKRRNVLRASAAYLALGWVVTQVTATVAPMMNLPVWIGPVVLWIGIVGFPFLVMFAWIYELTPEGLKRESEVVHDESITRVTGRRLDYAVIALMVVGIGLFAYDRMNPRAGPPAAPTSASAQSAAPASPASSEPEVDERSIAVLPFENMSSDKEQEYFSDGISEELLNLLAKIPALKVAARTSSFSFKGKGVEIPEIARQLRVAHVLEGSVRKSGNQVRITAQLIQASDGYHLWSHTYDRKLDDIFAIQDEIAADVVKQLKVTLLGAVPVVRKTNPEAYAMFLQGVQLGRQFTAEAYKQSDALYEKALALDPTYAPAWEELARNYMNEASDGFRPHAEGTRLARATIEKALAADPDYAPAHARLARIVLLESDLAAAARHMERALALAPEDLRVLESAAVLLAYLGRLDESAGIQRYLSARDPVNTTGFYNLALTLALSGRNDEAIAAMRTALSLSPGLASGNAIIAQALLGAGRAEDALTEALKDPSEFARLGVLPAVYHALGRKADSDAALVELVAKHGQSAAATVATIHAFRSDADLAFQWLAKAEERHEPVSLIHVDRSFVNVRSDPRWLPLLRKHGIAPEQLAKIEFKFVLPGDGGVKASG